MKQKAKQLREMSATQLESLRAEIQGQCIPAIRADDRNQAFARCQAGAGRDFARIQSVR